MFKVSSFVEEIIKSKKARMDKICFFLQGNDNWVSSDLIYDYLKKSDDTFDRKVFDNDIEYLKSMNLVDVLSSKVKLSSTVEAGNDLISSTKVSPIK